jgi:glycosyltransferase involved in cell wall biosynthesis
MKKQKLMFVITKSNWGGAQRYVYDLATSLTHEYDVVVAVGGNGLLVKKLHHKKIRTIEIPTLTRDISVGDDTNAFGNLLTIFRKERPDIVHLNSSKAGGLGALAARIAGVKRVVYTAHGWAFNEPVSFLSATFRWWASLATMLLVHRTITVSHFDTFLSPLDLHSVTVHNGIRDDVAFLTREEARKKICALADIPEDSFIVGTISELHTNKGIDILIQAAFVVDDIQVVVIGEGEERAALEQLLSDLELTNRVHLIGFVDEASKYLKAFDVFTLSSRKEGLPYTILEAGMAGVPVIASAVGGIPEIVNDQLSGDLVHAFNAEALAESLEEFKANPNTRARYAEALKERIHRYFNVEDMVRKTVEVYRS